jgi:hypothetical protein
VATGLLLESRTRRTLDGSQSSAARFPPRLNSTAISTSGSRRVRNEIARIVSLDCRSQRGMCDAVPDRIRCLVRRRGVRWSIAFESAGFGADGLPLSVQLVGRIAAEETFTRCWGRSRPRSGGWCIGGHPRPLRADQAGVTRFPEVESWPGTARRRGGLVHGLRQAAAMRRGLLGLGGGYGGERPAEG